MANMSGVSEAPIRFRTPPAIETLQGLFFRPLPGLNSAYQGLLWANKYRLDFPLVEERPTLEESIEQFGGDTSNSRGMTFRVMDKPEAPRLWAQSKEGTKVVQIQRNALISNWLRDNQKPAYVKYDVRKSEFEARLNALLEFLSQEKLGDLIPTSCMMTYVNHIDLESLELEPSRAADIFSFFDENMRFKWLSDPDQLSLNMSFPMPDERGRLHVQINPAAKATKDKQEYVLRFDLTARGRPVSNTIESALKWFELGHEWITRGFADMTRPAWHLEWERES
jgi:uncharacterized protein (TIGR04255 family)